MCNKSLAWQIHSYLVRTSINLKGFRYAGFRCIAASAIYAITFLEETWALSDLGSEAFVLWE
jgi:hypothetical protein